MLIFNYTVSAVILLIVVLLFLRAALPNREAPHIKQDELSPKELGFKISVLAMNGAALERRGGGVGVKNASRTLKRFLKNTEHRRTHGEKLYPFERALLSSREKIERCIAQAERRVSEYFALPHSGSLPRLYRLCELIVAGSGGYADIESVKRACEITNEYSPLTISELRLFGPMLCLCITEHLARIAVGAGFMHALTKKAKKDFKQSKVNLTNLKYAAYVQAYIDTDDFVAARRFAAVCLENGVDADIMSADSRKTCARYAADISSLTACIDTADAVSEPCFIIDMYKAYPKFAEKLVGFSRLDPSERIAYMSEFARKNVRRGTDEAAAVESADSMSLSRSFESVLPSKAVLKILTVTVCAIAALPAVAIAVFLPMSAIVCAVLALPVFISAALWLSASAVEAKIMRLGLDRGECNRTAAEFSSDTLTLYGAGRIERDEGITNRLSDYVSDVKKFGAGIEPIAMFAALVLVLISPAFTAYLLAAAFAREITVLVFGLRKAYICGGSAMGIVADSVLNIAGLPAHAAESAARLFGKHCPKTPIVIISIASGAALAVLSVVFGIDAATLTVGVSFALYPALKALSGKAVRRTRSLPEESTQRTYDGVGVRPKTFLIPCGDYFTVANERGGGCDFYRGKMIFSEMKLYLKRGDGTLERLKFVPPFVTDGGRTVNNAVSGDNTFSVETCGFDGGKTVTVRSRGGEFTLVCVHTVCEKYKEFERTENGVVLKGDNIFPWAGSDTQSEVTLDSGELFYGRSGGKSDILSLTVRSAGGTARIGFGAELDTDTLNFKATRIFSSGFTERGTAFCSSLSDDIRITPALCDTASFLLYGRCRYTKRLEGIIDTRFCTALLTLRSDGGFLRLFRGLKRLAILKSVGIPFNIVVTCFDEPEHFKRTSDNVNRMFERLSLDINGRTVCVNCKHDVSLYESLCAACPQADSIRHAIRIPNPERTVSRRVALPLDIPECAFTGTGGGVTLDGERVFASRSADCAENTVAGDGMGFTAYAGGDGYTFDGDGMLTGADSRTDTLPAEFVLIGENGHTFGIVPRMAAINESYCVHGAGFTRFVCTSDALKTECTLSVEEGAKICTVDIYNPRRRARTLSVLMCARPVLGESPRDTRNVLKLGERENGVFVCNTLTGKELFLYTDAEECERALGLETLTDFSGEACIAAGLKSEGETPALILSTVFKISPESRMRVRFALTTSDSFSFAYAGERQRVSALTFSSTDKAFDVFVNNLACDVNTALEVPKSRGEHFAARLVQSSALLPLGAKRLRLLIAESCRSRFTGADILLYRKGSKGERVVGSGAALFLPIAVAKYIDCTDERDLLFMRLNSLEPIARTRKCRISEHKPTVLEHCLEILKAAARKLSPCFGIDATLIALYALSRFLPLVRDPETRVELADISTDLADSLKGADLDTLSCTDLSWRVIAGVEEGITPSLLMQRAENARVSDKLWTCAALLKLDDAESAYALFETLNPVVCFGDAVSFKPTEAEGEMSEIMSAVALMLVEEGFFGTRLRGGAAVFAPRLPKKIAFAEIACVDDAARFKVKVDNSGSGKWRLCFDGIAFGGNSLALAGLPEGKDIVLKRSL